MGMGENEMLGRMTPPSEGGERAGRGPPLPSRMKGETPVNSTMSIGQARKMVEQLKIEASLCRIKVGGMRVRDAPAPGPAVPAPVGGGRGGGGDSAGPGSHPSRRPGVQGGR